MFVACMAIAFPVEIVVFSPARRASRKLLERMYEFVTLLDMGHRIVEYNQENLRIESLEGGPPGKTTSLIRSFPSKVSVRVARSACHALRALPLLHACMGA